MRITGTRLKAPTFIIFAVLLAGCSEPQDATDNTAGSRARPAKIVELQPSNAGLRRTYPGTLAASQQADLAFRVSGQLVELPAISGERVKAGDLLARLDPTDFENTIAGLQARFDLAKTQLDQARELLKKNLSSQLLFDQAESEFKSARAALQQAKDNLRYTRLQAPFDGVIARVGIENHQPVQAQAPIIQIRTDNELDIQFSVPESLLARLRRVDDPAVIAAFCGKVRFATHPGQTFRACHKEHESVPDPLTRNYAATFTLDRITDFYVLPGMTATIELDFSAFRASQARQSLSAPVEAVFSEENKKWLWTVDADMRARKTAVEVGRIAGGKIEITSNLPPGTKIVAAGVAYIREGMPVKPFVKQRGL
jgi:RND family efflux transporter MFP subunit